MKKVLSAFMLFVLLFSISSTNAFAEADSLRSNYEVYIASERVNVYNKPNGSKIDTIERAEPDVHVPIPNKFYVKKFVANHWVQVTHKKKNGKTIKGYVQTKYITPSFLSLGWMFIDSTSGLNLRTGPNTKSKVLITIPYGTRVTYIDSVGSNNSWYKVKYVVNKKSFIGYVSKKYLR